MHPFSAWRLALLSLCVCASLHGAAQANEIIAQVKGAVVAVGTYQADRAPPFRFRGTGFAVGEGDTIVTNAHVLVTPIDTAKMERLVVARPLGDGKTEVQDARLVTTDAAHDLALLRIGKRLPPMTLGNGEVNEGTTLLFTGFPIGNALGLYHATHRAMIAAVTPIAIPLPNARHMSAAIVRRLSGEAFPVFQLDATAYPGNSGSPLYDPQTGEVQGVINMVFVKAGKEAVLSEPSGITYAIPVTHLRALLQRAKQ